MTVGILLPRLRQPRRAPGWRPMRYVVSLALLLAACSAPTEGQEFDTFFAQVNAEDGVGVDAGPPCAPACGLNAPFCIEGACVTCRTSEDCAVGQACTPLFACHVKCASGADCPLSHMCNESGACEIVDGGS